MLVTGYLGWLQQLRTCYTSNSVRRFVLHFNLENKRDVIPIGAVSETIVRRATEFAGDRNVRRALDEANGSSSTLEVGVDGLRLNERPLLT